MLTWRYSKVVGLNTSVNRRYRPSFSCEWQWVMYMYIHAHVNLKFELPCVTRVSVRIADSAVVTDLGSAAVCTMCCQKLQKNNYVHFQKLHKLQCTYIFSYKSLYSHMVRISPSFPTFAICSSLAWPNVWPSSDNWGCCSTLLAASYLCVSVILCIMNNVCAQNHVIT